MNTTNISGHPVQVNSSTNIKKTSESKPEGGKKTVDDVLASLREMMPGWTISTSTAEWGDGFRNIQIDYDILQQMADDPKEMEKYKALVQDLENVITEAEKWGEEKPGQSIMFDVSLDAKGGATSLSIVKMLMGMESRTTFELPEDKSTWADLIRERLDDFVKGGIDDGSGSKSWVT